MDSTFANGPDDGRWPSRELVLRERYGELLTLADIAEVLRYPSQQAVRRAHARGLLPLELVRFPGRRRGWFATARTVAALLDEMDRTPKEPHRTKQGGSG